MKYFLLFTAFCGFSLLHAQTLADAEKILRSTCQKEGETALRFKKTSSYQDENTGITHFYFQQLFNEIPIRGAHAGVHLDRAGNLVHLTYQPAPVDQLSETTSVLKLTEAHEISRRERPGSKLFSDDYLIYVFTGDRYRLCHEIHGQTESTGTYWVIWVDAVTKKAIQVHDRVAECLFNHPAPSSEGAIEKEKTSVGGTFSMDVASVDQPCYFEVSNQSLPGRYNAFALPKESPLTTSRSIVTAQAIADETASPHGWHDTDGDASTSEFTYTKGNNTYAYYANPPAENPPAIPILRDPVNDTYAAGNVPWPAASSLDFDYQHHLFQPVGSAFIEDAVTNLFVVVNQAHDLFYRYGFTPAAGNFQTTNYGGESGAGDAVIARSQDGGGVNQASFSTPTDGMPPTMRMHLWSTGQPNSARDGSFENAVIIHEYGHGVAYRLIQGGGNQNCFFNFEQGGEGWSDFFGLLFTLNDYNGNGNIDRGTLGEGIRGLGLYALNRSPEESGLRPRHYTGFMNSESSAYFNEYTYADLTALGFPHGTGFLWATMLWDITLDLMDVYGFEPDLYETSSSAGNIRAMKLVMEGLKMTPCNPTFIDMRDAIIAADNAVFSGEHQELIWEAFARRGLGASAIAGGTAAFDTPGFRPRVITSEDEVIRNQPFTYSLIIENNTAGSRVIPRLTDVLDSRLSVVSLPSGAQLQDGTVTIDNGGQVGPHSSVTKNITVRYDSPLATEIIDELPVETTDLISFIPAGAWIPSGDFPNPNSNSTQSWFHLASGVPVESSLVFNLDLPATGNLHLSFFHDYDLETALDGGVLEILEGSEWVDLDDRILKNGYRAVIRDDLITPIGTPVPFTTLTRRRAWTGSSNGYQRCVVDLNGYAGTVTLRFRFASNNGSNVDNCDSSPGGCDGWFIDDIQLLDLVHVQNEACLQTSEDEFFRCGDVGRLGTIIWPDEAVLPLVDLDLNVDPGIDHLLLNWSGDLIRSGINYQLQRATGTSANFVNLVSAVNRTGFTDYTVKKNVRYFYRIFGYDEQGIPHYSNIVAASLQGESQSLSVFPNPARASVSVGWSLPAEENSFLELQSSKGLLVKQFPLTPGSRSILIPTVDLVAGVYVLRFVDKYGSSSTRVLIL